MHIETIFRQYFPSEPKPHRLGKAKNNSLKVPKIQEILHKRRKRRSPINKWKTLIQLYLNHITFAPKQKENGVKQSLYVKGNWKKIKIVKRDFKESFCYEVQKEARF